MMSPSLHVVLVDPWVSTPDDAGPDRFSALTRGIAAAGHHVTVLAARTLPPEPGRLSAVDYRRVLPPLPRRFGFPAGMAWRFFCVSWAYATPMCWCCARRR
jgi:hypothetical protein